MSAIIKTISLPLSDEATSTYIGGMSSNQYNDLVVSALTPLDLLYTFALRYARVIETDIPRAHNDPVNFDSDVFNFTAHNLDVSIPATALFLGASAASLIHEQHKQKKARISYKLIYDKFQHGVHSSSAANKKIYDINYYLDLIMRDDKELQAKYSSIKINAATKALEFKPKHDLEETKRSLGARFKEKVVKPAWTSLNIASFVYWILWIGMGVFTGNLAGAGINSLPPLVEFGVPVFMALLYPVKKIYNYFRDKISTEDFSARQMHRAKQAVLQRHAAIKEASQLFRRALLRQEFDLKKMAFIEELTKHDARFARKKLYYSPVAASAASMDKEILARPKSKKLKSAMTLATVASGMYVAMQYGSWIFTDFFEVVLKHVFTAATMNIAGGILMGAAVLFGAYKAYQRYQTSKQLEKSAALATVADHKHQVDLEAKLDKYEKLVAAKQKILGLPAVPSNTVKYNEDQFFSDIHRRGTGKLTQAKKILKRAYVLVNGFTTGAFIARLIFIKGSAILLPALAVTFSNPVTIGIIAGIGLLYGVLKAYEYHIDRKEARAQTLLSQRKERLECLQQQVELAKLESRLLSEKIKQSNKTATPTVIVNTSKKTAGLSHGLFKPKKPATRLRSLSDSHIEPVRRHQMAHAS